MVRCGGGGRVMDCKLKQASAESSELEMTRVGVKEAYGSFESGRWSRGISLFGQQGDWRAGRKTKGDAVRWCFSVRRTGRLVRLQTSSLLSL